MKYWEINGHSLEFDEEDHIYICDGIIVPSVSTILKAFYNDYTNVSRSVLERAREKGTALHEAIELYETTGQESDLQEFKNYLFLKKHFKFNVISSELPIIYEENGKVLFAGQLDQIIEMDGRRGINDLKRVSSPNKDKIALQVNLYKLGYEQSYQEKIDFLTFTHLREDKRKFNQLPINEALTREILKKYYQE